MTEQFQSKSRSGNVFEPSEYLRIGSDPTDHQIVCIADALERFGGDVLSVLIKVGMYFNGAPCLNCLAYGYNYENRWPGMCHTCAARISPRDWAKLRIERSRWLRRSKVGKMTLSVYETRVAEFQVRKRAGAEALAREEALEKQREANAELERIRSDYEADLSAYHPPDEYRDEYYYHESEEDEIAWAYSYHSLAEPYPGDAPAEDPGDALAPSPEIEELIKGLGEINTFIYELERESAKCWASVVASLNAVTETDLTGQSPETETQTQNLFQVASPPATEVADSAKAGEKTAEESDCRQTAEAATPASLATQTEKTPSVAEGETDHPRSPGASDLGGATAASEPEASGLATADGSAPSHQVDDLAAPIQVEPSPQKAGWWPFW